MDHWPIDSDSFWVMFVETDNLFCCNPVKQGPVFA